MRTTIVVSAVVTLVACSGGDAPKPVASELISAAKMSPQYEFIVLDSPGYPNTQIQGINDREVLAGIAQDEVGYFTPAKGLVINRGKASIADTGDVNVQFDKINNSNKVAVGYYGADLIWHAGVYDVRTNKLAPLPDIQGAVLNAAFGINNGVDDRMWVIGSSFDENVANAHGWVWDGQHYTAFDEPDAFGPCGGTVADGANDDGVVIGYFFDSSCSGHGFVKKGSTYTQLDYPGSVFTMTSGINNQGVIVGTFIDATGGTHGFLWQEGTYTQFDIPSELGALAFVTGNNDWGAIIGEFSDTAGILHGFEAKPH